MHEHDKKKEVGNTRYNYEGWLFDDFADFLHTMEAPLTPEQQRNADRMGNSSESTSDPSWYGTKDWPEAMKFAKFGWEEGLVDMSADMEAMTPYVVAALGQLSEDMAPAGYLPNVPAFCAGSPACMHTQGDQFVARTPVLRLLVNFSANAGVDGDSWRLRGAALCSMVDYFEQIGIRCEIEIVSVSTHYNDHNNSRNMVEIRIPVKRAEEPVELSRLAFMLGNASVCRRFDFRICEMSTKAKLGGGYGSAKDAEPEPDQIYFPTCRRLHSEQQALAHVLGHMARYLEPELKARVGEDWREVLGDSMAAF